MREISKLGYGAIPNLQESMFECFRLFKFKNFKTEVLCKILSDQYSNLEFLFQDVSKSFYVIFFKCPLVLIIQR